MASRHQASRVTKVKAFERINERGDESDEDEEEIDIEDDQDSAADSVDETQDLDAIHNRQQAEQPEQPQPLLGYGRGRGLPAQPAEPVPPARGREILRRQVPPAPQPPPGPEPARECVDKNGLEWHRDPPQQHRRGLENIRRREAGPIPEAHKNTLAKTWELYMTPKIIQNIVNYSKQKADSLGVDPPFTTTSLKAVIGFMYFRGASFDQKIPIDELYSETASTFYRTVMAKNMVELWLRFMRFDDLVTRVDRQRDDRFAPIRQFWNAWNMRLQRFFNNSGFITVDEQLVSSRCRSPNRVFNPKKPGKFGELIRWSCDS
jgi:hypothetical protein